MAQNRKLSRGLALLRPSSAPLALIAGADSSGYIGNLCSRETGLNFYISNEMGRVSASPFRPPRRFRLAPSLELDERDLFSLTFTHFVFCS